MKNLFGHDKVEESIERIRIHEPPEGYYGATSWGKDSLVIMALCDLAHLKKSVEWHFHLTTIDPPELIYFARSQNRKDVIWDRPKQPFLKRLVYMGFPMPDKRWCCKEYKEYGGSGRIVITGVRWEESEKRAERGFFEPCFQDETKHYLNPILDWTSNEIWEFILERKIAYPSLYDEGFNRIGCLFCPKNYGRAYHLYRWPKFAKSFELAFQRLYDRRKAKGAKSISRWNDGKEMFRWWITEKHSCKNPDQMMLW
jgi:phosphoadenosine phosphosulfate reductase